MNELNLSKRLALVVENIPEKAKLADIGSDHAYLPCYAYLQNKIIKAIAGEVNLGPFQSAQNQVQKLNLERVISVRKGDGLEVIQAGEVNTVTICGMGGGLISSILESGKEKLVGVERLILQPNMAADHIRIWLHRNRWNLVSEDIVEEDNKIYEVLVAEPGSVTTSPYSDNIDIELLLGPFLMREKATPFIKKWRLELELMEKVLQQLDKANQTEEIREKKKSLQSKMKKVEEVISNE